MRVVAFTALAFSLLIAGCKLKLNVEVDNHHPFAIVVYENVLPIRPGAEPRLIGEVARNQRRYFPRALTPPSDKHQIEFRTKSGRQVSVFTVPDEQFRDDTLYVKTSPAGNVVY